MGSDRIDSMMPGRPGPFLYLWQLLEAVPPPVDHGDCHDAVECDHRTGAIGFLAGLSTGTAANSAATPSGSNPAGLTAPFGRGGHGQPTRG
jgi:hypothetical protein